MRLLLMHAPVVVSAEPHSLFHPPSTQYVPSTSQSSLIVAVRVRPLLRTENSKGGKKPQDIMRVIDGRVVVVLDPDESKVGSRERLAQPAECAWQPTDLMRCCVLPLICPLSRVPLSGVPGRGAKSYQGKALHL